MDAYQSYKSQSINTMTPGELLNLLYDELVKRLTQADLALKQQNYPIMEDSVDRCIRIIQYLDVTLNDNYDISKQLHKLYEFFTYELKRVRIGRNQKVLDDVRPMITDLRDSFRQAGVNVAAEK